MIHRFQHRGLKILYDKNDRRGVSLELVEKTARMLARLDVATRKSSSCQASGFTGLKAISRGIGPLRFEATGELYFDLMRGISPTLI